MARGANFFVDLEAALHAFLFKLACWDFSKSPAAVGSVRMFSAASGMRRHTQGESANACEEGTEEFHVRISLFGWRRRGRVMSKNGMVDGVRLTFWTLSEAQQWQDQQEVGEIVSRCDLRQMQEGESRRFLDRH